MAMWLLKRWHWFTLGRTARTLSGTGFPGSAASVAYELGRTAAEHLPLGIAHTVAQRTATDIPFGTVRIVLEVPQ